MLKDFKLNLIIKYSVFLTFLIFIGAPVQAEEEYYRPLKEYQVTAVFIYNLIDFVEWPKKKSRYTICVDSSPKIIQILRQIKKDPDYLHQIEIVEPQKKLAFKECDIIYFGSNNIDHIKKIITQIQNYPILTTSSTNGFTKIGGLIQFDFSGDSVNLIGNSNLIKKSKLLINADLLGIMQFEDAY